MGFGNFFGKNEGILVNKAVIEGGIITAARVRRAFGLRPEPGRRVFVEIEGHKIEMVWKVCKGASSGAVWYFLLPGAKKPSKAIRIEGDKIAHLSKAKPLWWVDGPVGRFLEIQQRARDAREIMARPGFRKNYGGKPTRRYLRLLRDSSRYMELSDHDLLYNIERIASGY